METVTIRELRQCWPAVEKRLAAVGELTVTRDGTVVAVLASPPKPAGARAAKRFDSLAHEKLIREIWGTEKPRFSSEQLIAEERRERTFSGKSK